MLQNRIDQLNTELKNLKSAQKNCKHTWTNPEYDPEIVQKEVLTGTYETHGVHHWPQTQFVDVSKDRWSRSCSICGLKEYTYTQKIVKVVSEPRFD